ncbi:ATP-binding cassette domain-containing protein [Nonomuraea bangladeshensis]|uniref:ATP-binding cassette domain-containing protein n=1 Tax=Nonomuraea bangladeshensis TaxID=404385 RepID=UPI0031E151F5
MLLVESAVKSIGERTIWSDLSFSVETGEMMAVTGRSGSGKSTLLNCIGLLDRIDEGRIVINGHNVTRCNSKKARKFRRDHLGYVFQNYALIEGATVRDNLDVAVVRGTRRAARGSYESVLDQVGLGGRVKDKIFQLSGGEQQRVALARLLVKRPSIVLADEPTGSLDAWNAELVVQILRDMANAGCAVLIATHNELVAKACDTQLEL